MYFSRIFRILLKTYFMYVIMIIHYNYIFYEVASALDT